MVDGVRLFPCRSWIAVRILTKGVYPILTHINITYQLPSRKLLYVVVRDTLVGITEDEITRALVEFRYGPEGAARIWCGLLMPMILDKLPREQKQIYQVKRLLELEGLVKPLR